MAQVEGEGQARERESLSPPPPGGHTLVAGRIQGPVAEPLLGTLSGEKRKWGAGPAPFLSLCSLQRHLNMMALPDSGVTKRGRKERELNDPVKKEPTVGGPGH